MIGKTLNQGDADGRSGVNYTSRSGDCVLQYSHRPRPDWPNLSSYKRVAQYVLESRSCSTAGILSSARPRLSVRAILVFVDGAALSFSCVMVAAVSPSSRAEARLGQRVPVLCTNLLPSVHGRG